MFTRCKQATYSVHVDLGVEVLVLLLLHVLVLSLSPFGLSCRSVGVLMSHGRGHSPAGASPATFSLVVGTEVSLLISIYA